MAVIEFNNVCFSADNVEILKDINIQIQQGDFVAVIGSNGAGKSTLSKLCNGLNKPCKGDVFILGKNTKTEKISDLAKHIGFLFQNPDRQICCQTIAEEIAFSLKNIGIHEKEVKSRVQKTLAEFGFNPDTEPFNMSRGQKQRLCLACIIALHPEILILDEPTTGLDYRECMEIMNHIRTLNQKGSTIIMICHDMEIVLDFAKTVIVMNKGQIVAAGKTRDILSDNRILSQANLLKPQIAQVSELLDEKFKDVFTVREMISTIKNIMEEKS